MLQRVTHTATPQHAATMSTEPSEGTEVTATDQEDKPRPTSRGSRGSRSSRGSKKRRKRRSRADSRPESAKKDASSGEGVADIATEATVHAGDDDAGTQEGAPATTAPDGEDNQGTQEDGEQGAEGNAVVVKAKDGRDAAAEAILKGVQPKPGERYHVLIHSPVSGGYAPRPQGCCCRFAFADWCVLALGVCCGSPRPLGKYLKKHGGFKVSVIPDALEARELLVLSTHSKTPVRMVRDRWLRCMCACVRACGSPVSCTAADCRIERAMRPSHLATSSRDQGAGVHQVGSHTSIT